MPPLLPFTRLPAVEVFAVGDRTAQFTWHRLPSGTLTAEINGIEHTLGESGQPGAAEITGLAPGSTHRVQLHVDGAALKTLELTTLADLGPEPLARFATISDLHLGDTGFGLLKEIREEGAAEPYPLRCARAAVAEAQAWGAELLVIKGDITSQAHAEEWEMFDAVLDGCTIPILAVPGNHDTVTGSACVDATSALRARGLFPAAIHSVEVAGARIVAIDSTIPGNGRGSIASRLALLAQAVDIDRPVLLFSHHHFQQYRLPRIWPLGIPRHDGVPVIDELVEINPDLMISSGHTHRNRARRHASALITEVSSTKDYPGVWAGYSIYADGVRQTVRRIAQSDCISWNDRTHAAVGGIWGRWSPGTIDDRCLYRRWSNAGGSAQDASRSNVRASSTSAFS